MTIRNAVRLLTFAAAAVCLNVSAAVALEQKTFDAAAFKAAQDAGKPVVVHVTAPWCPTCKAQHASIDSLAAKPEFASVTLFQIDFDTQADAWKSVGARSQSTLVAYAGSKETGRLVGETKAAPIEALITSALAK